MIKKPKKNIRRRNVDSDDDNNGNDERMDVENVSNGIRKGTLKTIKPTPVLSFADDEEENGEVFQIKKSSYSKKFEKKMQKERRKKKIDNNLTLEEKDLTENCDEIKLEEEILLTVSKEKEHQVRSEKEQNLILNGRAALMAGKNEASSSDDDEGSTRYKFSQPNRAEIMLESGKIPDAAAIHAARKRRQRARQCNQEFIPIENPTPAVIAPHKLEKKGSSRLVREEDEASDEERITMGTGLEANDITSRKANYYETLEPGIASWPDITPVMSCSIPIAPLPPPMITCTKELATPEILTQRLRDRLKDLKELHSAHCSDIVRAETELRENRAETQRLEEEAPDLAKRFRFYQDYRGYVTDLVECLDEKVPGLERLEDSMIKLWAERALYFAGRRRLDVRDQADEMSQMPKNSQPKWSREEEEARTRRAAEREGRRTRRRRARELRSIPVTHIDGMSSDDEETELEAATFGKKLEEIRRLGEGLLEDVEEEFGTTEGVVAKLERWREYDDAAYREAYVSLCLPKMLSPLVRFQLLTWNLLQSDAFDLESTSWWSRLLTFGLTDEETMASLTKDPDLLLLPTLVQKVILPKVTKLIEKSWDPLSNSQTIRLVNFLNKYVTEMPGMTPKSAQVKALLEAIVTRLKHAVDNDVFIPISFVGGEGKGSNSVFFQRQFACAVKLLRNALSFQGLLSPEHLHGVALDSLLNRYLLAALRTCQPCDAISKANMIVSTFPRWWFQTETKIPKLEMFGKYLKQISTNVHSYDVTEKNSHELVQSLIKTIQLSCPNPL